MNLLLRIWWWFKDIFEGKPLGGLRSPEWPKVRKAHLKLQPECQLCGGTETLQVHHKMPFHLKPELELDPDNLITLCQSKANGIECHRGFGHLGDFRAYNPDVVRDTGLWNTKLKTRPY